MKTVYDYFVDYTSTKLNLLPSQISPSILQGITDYLKDVDLFSIKDADGHLSEIEFTRFRLMPAKTLEVFFERYSIRSKIEAIKNESELFALSRIQSGKLITKEVFQEKAASFYEVATILASDKRYLLWLERTEHEIFLNLNYALGISREISIALHEKIEMFGER